VAKSGMADFARAVSKQVIHQLEREHAFELSDANDEPESTIGVVLTGTRVKFVIVGGPGPLDPGGFESSQPRPLPPWTDLRFALLSPRTTSRLSTSSWARAAEK